MMYESKKTERGNVGVSYESQEAADKQARTMDENNCTGCIGCTDCRRCTGCTDCMGCMGCTDCMGCRRCIGCTDCTGCIGTLRWGGKAAEKLLSINGLYWSVSTDGKSIQIGCQNHPADAWAMFSDEQIARMDSHAVEFWRGHKELILSLAKARAAEDQR